MRNFQQYFAYILAALVVLMFLAVPVYAEQREVPCFHNNGNVQAQLVNDYNEIIIEEAVIPEGRAELWANDETGAYTILFFPAGKQEAFVCLVGTGINPALIDRSQPA